MPTLEGSRAFLSTAQARVLVVDDERRLRSALVSSLSLLGYQVDQAASGQQALEMLRQRSYDLMLLDIRMPGMDGIEVMHRVRQVCPGLVIIVLTGHASLESAITAVKCDAADYLLKPIGLSALADAVANALQKRSRRDQSRSLPQEALTAAAGPSPADTVGSTLLAGPVTLDVEKRVVVVIEAGEPGERVAELSPSETALLACLMRHPGAVTSCLKLAHTALGYRDLTEVEARSLIRPHICRLRRKIEPHPDHPRLIRTVVGKGYCFTAFNI